MKRPPFRTEEEFLDALLECRILAGAKREVTDEELIRCWALEHANIEQGIKALVKKKDIQIIREKERLRMTGLSRVQWWRLEKRGKVPRRIQLGENSVGWLKSEIETWITVKASLRWK